MTFPLNPIRLGIMSLASVCLWSTIGCGIDPKQVASGGTTTPPDSGSLISSGNWQGTLVAAQGKKALGPISGSIDQSGGMTSAGQFTTSVFRVASPCYASTPVPAQGFVKDSTITLNSFAVEKQYLQLTGTVAGNGTSITGSYMAYGGCADGSGGSLSMMRYMPFTGTYTSADPQQKGLSLTTAQSDGADGAGFFPVAATVKFNNVGCFTDGTAMLTDNPVITGANFSLPITTNERSGSVAQLTGTIDQSATHVLQYSLAIKGGACDGQSFTGQLTKQ